MLRLQPREEARREYGIWLIGARRSGMEHGRRRPQARVILAIAIQGRLALRAQTLDQLVRSHILFGAFQLGRTVAVWNRAVIGRSPIV